MRSWELGCSRFNATCKPRREYETQLPEAGKKRGASGNLETSAVVQRQMFEVSMYCVMFKWQFQTLVVYSASTALEEAAPPVSVLQGEGSQSLHLKESSFCVRRWLKDREVKQHLLMCCKKSLKLETKKVAAVGPGKLAEVRVPAPTKIRSPSSKYSRNGRTAWWQCGTLVTSEESTTDTRIYDPTRTPKTNGSRREDEATGVSTKILVSNTKHCPTRMTTAYEPRAEEGQTMPRGCRRQGVVTFVKPDRTSGQPESVLCAADGVRGGPVYGGTGGADSGSKLATNFGVPWKDCRWILPWVRCLTSLRREDGC